MEISLLFFQAWNALNNLLRDEWIWYWINRPQFWVFHFILFLWLCRRPVPNVQIPRDFSASTDAPVEHCPGFSRVNHKAICNPPDKQQVVWLAQALSSRHELGHSLKDFLCLQRLDCKMQCNLSTLFASACYTSSRQAVCYLTNATDSITTAFQNVFDVPNGSVSLGLYAQAIYSRFNLARLLLAVVSILL